MAKPKILFIAITGRARTGKDTTCEILQSFLPDLRRFALADNIKRDLTAKGLGPLEEYYPCKDPVRRRIAQLWGNEYGKMMDLTYWVLRICKDIIKEHILGDDISKIAITDVRSVEEAKIFVDEFKGYLLHVKADNRVPLDPFTADHSNEQEFDAIHKLFTGNCRYFEIDNNGSLEDLGRTLKWLCNAVFY